jgi:hypothetical protein
MRQIDIFAVPINDCRFTVDGNRRYAFSGIRFHRKPGILGKAKSAEKQEQECESKWSHGCALIND